jgi:hypothetical protein
MESLAVIRQLVYPKEIRRNPILHGTVDSLRVVWDFCGPRRSRRRTPMDPADHIETSNFRSWRATPRRVFARALVTIRATVDSMSSVTSVSSLVSAVMVATAVVSV